MTNRYHTAPDQASHGERICIMLGDAVLARTPMSHDRDEKNANFLVLAAQNHESLVNTLKNLLNVVDETANRCGWCDHGERESARKLLANIGL